MSILTYDVIVTGYTKDTQTIEKLVTHATSANGAIMQATQFLLSAGYKQDKENAKHLRTCRNILLDYIDPLWEDDVRSSCSATITEMSSDAAYAVHKGLGAMSEPDLRVLLHIYACGLVDQYEGDDIDNDEVVESNSHTR